MTLDHIAIAVRNVEAAADRLCSLLGYERRTAKVTNTRQKVNVIFLGREGSLDLKLIEPSAAPVKVLLRIDRIVPGIVSFCQIVGRIGKTEID